MEKKFSFKIEEIPVQENFGNTSTVEFFIDRDVLSKKFQKINSDDLEEITFFEKWDENIGSDGVLFTFDTMLETVFLTESEEIKKYFEIYESDKDYLEDLNITNQEQHAKLVNLYTKIQDRFKSLILHSIKNKDSQNLLLLIINEYNKSVQRKSYFFIEKIKEYKQEFYEKLVQLLENGERDYDLDKIKRIINHTQINFTDPLGWAKYEGTVTPDHTITMNLMFGPFYTDDEDLEDIQSQIWDFRNNYVDRAKHAFFHELLHIITSNRKQIITEEKSGEKITSIQSTGLVFRGHKDRFNWLNEALTEITTLDLNEEDEITSYYDEIRLYELLIKKTTDPQAWKELQRTYFFNARKDTTLGLQQWKENRKRLDSSFGPDGKNFLVKLDNWIEENGGMPDGVKKAREIISKWENGKPNPKDFLSKTL